MVGRLLYNAKLSPFPDTPTSSYPPLCMYVHPAIQEVKGKNLDKALLILLFENPLSVLFLP